MESRWPIRIPAWTTWLLLAMFAVGCVSEEKKEPTPVPKVTLKWPGEPNETLLAGGYSVDFTIPGKRDRRFRCVVMRLTGKDDEAASPESLLDAWLKPGQKDETNRTNLEFGRHKYPAARLEYKTSGKDMKLQFQKRLIVIADRVLFDLYVYSDDQAYLSDKEVTDFFNSLEIPEK